MTAYQERLGRFTVQTMTGLNNVVYRLSNGRVAGHVPGGAPICLLTTIGRKSGRARTVPLLYLPDGDNLVIVASKGGMSTHPAWYLNLQAQPLASVETGSRVPAVVARPATDARARRACGHSSSPSTASSPSTRPGPTDRSRSWCWNQRPPTLRARLGPLTHQGLGRGRAT